MVNNLLKCVILLYFSVSVVEMTHDTINETDIGNYTRDARFFPFFSIIRFENKECGGATSFNGTCFTRRECNDLGGSITGTCASKRGVCCIIQRSCGSTSNVNNTYFTNAGYPGPFGGGSRCTITINRCNSDICQLRLDFLDLSLAQPNGDGVCVSDALTVTGGSSRVPRICGDNTDQHVYVNFNGNSPITISIDASTAVSFNRRWNIKIMQLACACPTLAPSGCLMYHTGVSGTVNSFNYGTMQSQATSTAGLLGTREMANLNYGVCIRMEAGYCSIQWTQGGPFSFTVTGDVDGSDNTVLGTPLGSNTGALCTSDFVVIPNPIAPQTSDRFCGLGFPTVTTASKPFVLTVVTNGNEIGDVTNRGFSLTYTQQPCLPTN